jgi:photosystem II stability/assembly factor-like uncharacterized protein
MPSGFEGRVVYSLAVDPADGRTAYAVVYPGGLYGTADGGQTWTELDATLGSGVQDAYADELVVDATNHHVYTSLGERVFRSTDGGTTWTGSSPSPQLRGGVRAICPRGPVVYAAWSGYLANRNPDIIFGSHIGKSDDGGATFVPLLDLMRFYQSDTLFGFSVAADLDGRTVFTTDALSFGDSYGYGHVYKSADAGWSWRVADAGLPSVDGTWIANLTVDPREPSTVYATQGRRYEGRPDPGYGFFYDEDLNLFRSRDAGAHWQRIGEGLPDGPVLSITVDGGSSAVFVSVGGPNGSTFASRDRGDHWRAVAGGPPAGSKVWSLAFGGGQHPTLYALTDYVGDYPPRGALS